VVLDRPRHEQLLTDIRKTGARVKLISDGDIAASIQTAMSESEVDVLMGVGGTTEGVISAAAIHCIGGDIQCKAWPRNEDEKKAALEDGVDIDMVYKTEDLIDSDDVFFAATGVSSGELLKGVRYFSGGAETQSMAMRCRSGTVRMIESRHNFERLNKLGFLKLN
jgi:fructose-1,6-bisphosphatase II